MKRRSSFYSLLVILLLIATACSQQAPDASNTGHKLLLVSFDGFRYDYLSKTDTPNFDSITAEGVKSKGMIPVFPSKTFPNHYSIATGLYPEHTGLVGNTMYDPKWDKWYRISDRKAVENGKWYGGEPIWNTAQKQGLKTGTMFWVGSEADIQGMRPDHWKPYNGDMPYKARIDTVIKWLTLSGGKDVDFATLYFELVDDAGHHYGPDSDSLKAAVSHSDQLVGYLKERLQDVDLWKNINLIILADHGMAQLSGDKIIELDSITNMDDVKYTIWGPMTMIEPKEGKTETVYRQLKEHENHYKVYKKEDIPERYHLKNNRRVTDIIMVADLPYTILTKATKQRFLDGLPSGTHGYDNNEKQMQALFVAHGPAFKQGVTVPTFQNIHVYDLMCHLLGIKPAPNDGSLDSTKVMLR